MKKIFTLFASSLLAVAVFATGVKPTSMLTITSAGQEEIRVVMDGKTFEPNNNSVIIENINTGTHDIAVYRQKKNGFATFFGKKYEMLYNTTFNVRNRTHVVINIDRKGRVTTQETKLTRIGNGNGGYGNDNNGQWDDYDTHEGYASGMNDREFTRVIQSIQKEWLESNKLKSASQIAKTSAMSASQVRQLVLLFDIESNKLEIAKQAYGNTVDKRNYNIVSDLFNYSSSKATLDRYIRNYR